MALFKEVMLSNGIALSYWRILRVDIWTNDHILVELKGYINKNARDQEKIAITAENDSESSETDPIPGSDPYTDGRFFILEYNETFGVTSAYEYLKTLPEFEGATDI